MTFAEYLRVDATNWSLLRWMARSPAHYQYAKAHGTEDTKAKAAGRALHVAVLEPAEFGHRYAVWAGGDRRAKGYAAFVEASPGREILTEAEYEEVKAKSLAVHSHPVAGPLVRQCEAEFTLRWHLDGRACKGRLDGIHHAGHRVVDLKGLRDASPEGMGRAVMTYQYLGQAAFYVDGCRAAFGGDWGFSFIAVESSPPYAVGVYRVPPEALEKGRMEYRRLLRRLSECEESGVWPGYGETEQVLQLPNWAWQSNEAGEVVP